MIDIACTEREMIEKVFQYGDIHVQYLYLPNISASIAKAIINGMMRGGREEGYKGKGEGEREGRSQRRQKRQKRISQ